jgi:hypothetical protein
MAMPSHFGFAVENCLDTLDPAARASVARFLVVRYAPLAAGDRQLLTGFCQNAALLITITKAARMLASSAMKERWCASGSSIV